MTTMHSHSDPKLIGESLGRGHSDYATLDVHEPCGACGTQLQWNSNLISMWGKGSVICDECCNQRRDEARAFEESALEGKVQTSIEKVIPPLYLDTDPEKLPKQELDQILAWRYEPQDEKYMSMPCKGIYAIGPTRAGKTRAICLLVTRLIEEGRNVQCLFAGELQTQMMEHMRSERGYAAWKRDLINADVLFLDDLFNERVTPRTESTWFEIIDGRMNYKRPTLITSQYSARDAVKLFSEARRGAAMLNRLRETSHVIAFGDSLQGELPV